MTDATDDEQDGPTPPPARRSWALIVLGIVAVAALAFAIGRFTAFGTVAEPAPNAADIGFARDMQVHHGQAVEMAMDIYRATDDDELRSEGQADQAKAGLKDKLENVKDKIKDVID